VQQRDVRRPVGVVLDRGDAGGHAVLAPLEVDAPVQALGARRRGGARSCARALRPPDLVRPSTRVFSGSVLVISE
jgi:hypothetical protein